MSKLVKMVLTGVLFAAAIIGVVVVMTPLPDEVKPYPERTPDAVTLSYRTIGRKSGGECLAGESGKGSGNRSLTFTVFRCQIGGRHDCQGFFVGAA